MSAALLLALVAIPILLSGIEPLLNLVGLSFLVNLGFLAYVILKTFSGRTTCLGLIHALGVWLMLVIAPMALFASNNLEFSDFFGIYLSDRAVLVSNAVVLVWSVAFYLGYSRTRGVGWFKLQNVFRGANLTGIWFQIIAGALALAYIYSIVGSGTVTRAAWGEAFAGEVPTYNLVVEYPVRMASMFALSSVFLILRQKRPASQRIPLTVALVVLAVAVLLLNNPIAAARFYTGAVLLGIGFTVWFSKQRDSLVFLVLFMIGIFGFIPLDLGRLDSSLEDAVASTEWSIERAFLGDSFRTYESVPAAVEYIAENGSTRGHQLAGNLLFWIPRSAWRDKPIGTGAMMAETYGVSFTNVACALQCESLVNAGFLGVPFLALLWGRLTRQLDNLFQEDAKSTRVTLIKLLYPFLLGAMFFITRGDFLSPFSYSLSMSLGVLPLVVGSLIGMVTSQSEAAPARPWRASA